MRLLHVVATLNPAFGGPPAVVTRLAAAQSMIGHRVGIVAHTPSTPEARRSVDEFLRTVPHGAELAIHELSDHARWGRLPRKSAEQLAALIARHDLVHIHGVWEPLLLDSSRAARRLNIPYVVTPHGMLSPWALRNHWLKKKLALLLSYRRMLQGARFIHTLNADEARLIEPQRFSPPLRVIANGVFLKELHPLPPPGAFRCQYPELGGSRFILFLSRLHPKKGLNYLVEAFARLAHETPALRLVLAGPDAGARQSVVEHVNRLGVSDRVHLVGPLYGASKAAAMVDASCFCLPSEHEAFSVAITEALACSLPVVISEGCHFPQVAECGAGLVVPLNVEALADGLRRVLGDTNEAAMMGARGSEVVARSYTWQAIAQQMCKAYEDVLVSRPPDA